MGLFEKTFPSFSKGILLFFDLILLKEVTLEYVFEVRAYSVFFVAMTIAS